jgi:hypothetical protein
MEGDVFAQELEIRFQDPVVAYCLGGQEEGFELVQTCLYVTDDGVDFCPIASGKDNRLLYVRQAGQAMQGVGEAIRRNNEALADGNGRGVVIDAGNDQMPGAARW